MKLTTLERKAFEVLLKDIRILESTYNNNSDSIQDFICKQFEVTTHEPVTLEQVRDSLDVIMGKLCTVIDNFEVLNQHFTAKD